MEEYYFLFALAFLWTIFASVQDLKKREVSNWLNFSFILFALAYRAFYAVSNKNPAFLVFGFLGFAVFFIFAHALYYTKTFGGGDAKLLMGFGAVLPVSSYEEILPLSLVFLFLLFLIGTVYSLVFSIFIAVRRKNKFEKEFVKLFKKNKYAVMASSLLFIFSLLLINTNYLFLFSLLISFIPLVFIYARAVDKCMISLLSPEKLTAGDWLEKEIRIGNKTVKKTVHGLSAEDIKLIKKHGKNVLIKTGIPFAPSFLIALIIMALFFLTLQLRLSDLLSLF